jgi:hypothetical protein
MHMTEICLKSGRFHTLLVLTLKVILDRQGPPMSIGLTRKVFSYGKTILMNPEREQAISQTFKKA